MATTNPVETYNRFMHFSGKKRKRALRKLAVYVEKNIPIVEALRDMSRFASRDGRAPNDYGAKVFSRWARLIAGGLPASRAMLGYIPEFERQIIVASEQYGRLEDGIREALSIREGLDTIRAVMRKALFYPVLLYLVVIAFFYYMATFVLPGYKDALALEKWPDSVRSLYNTSMFFKDNLATIIILSLLATGVIIWSLPRWTGKIRYHLDKFPPYAIYRIVYGTIFLLSLAGYVKAGMTSVLTLETILKTADPWYAERIKAILREVKNGSNIGDALDRIGYEFPSRQVIEDLRVFSRYKGAEDALTTMGREMMEESIQEIQVQTQIIGTVSMFVVTALAFWFIMAIFDFQAAVGKALSH